MKTPPRKKQKPKRMASKPAPKASAKPQSKNAAQQFGDFMSGAAGGAGIVAKRIGKSFSDDVAGMKNAVAGPGSAIGKAKSMKDKLSDALDSK